MSARFLVQPQSWEMFQVDKVKKWNFMVYYLKYFRILLKYFLKYGKVCLRRVPDTSVSLI